MPRVHSCAALLACSVMLLVLERPAHAEGDSLRLTRAQVQERAVGQSAEMVRRLAVRTQTRLLERESYPFNPEVSVEVTGTPAPWSGTDYARRIMLEQELDLRGERRARGAAPGGRPLPLPTGSMESVLKRSRPKSMESTAAISWRSAGRRCLRGCAIVLVTLGPRRNTPGAARL